MSGTGEIQAILDGASFLITYVPLRTEVDFKEIVRMPSVSTYDLPQRASLDPIQEAESTVTMAAGREAIILLPGRAFDASGTRLGQGGGWYDRFLARVPREWLRIGFCFADQFSSTPLARAAWDQAVDIVCVVDRKTGHATVYSNV